MLERAPLATSRGEHGQHGIEPESEDAKEAFGHGVRAKRSKAGAISFEVIAVAEAPYAPLQ